MILIATLGHYAFRLVLTFHLTHTISLFFTGFGLTRAVRPATQWRSDRHALAGLTSATTAVCPAHKAGLQGAGLTAHVPPVRPALCAGQTTVLRPVRPARARRSDRHYVAGLTAPGQAEPSESKVFVCVWWKCEHKWICNDLMWQFNHLFARS